MLKSFYWKQSLSCPGRATTGEPVINPVYLSAKKNKHMTDIPSNQKCDQGCGHLAAFFSEHTGRYRCMKHATQCPAVRKRNSNGLSKAHAAGKMKTFTDEHRLKSQVSHRVKLQENRSFEELGYRLRKNIVLEEQDFKCLHCGIDEWQGQKLILELDHIDGDRNNNVRDNLRCLCPNCHSVTDTWKQGQNGKRKCTDEQIIEAYRNTGTISKTLKELDMNWGSGYTVKRVLYKYGLIESL